MIKSDEDYDKRLRLHFLLTVIIIALVVFFTFWITKIGALQSEGKASEVIYNDLFLKNPNIPITPNPKTYGSIVDGQLEFWMLVVSKYPKMERLLMCLAKEESTYNPDAIGDYGLAKGILQIHTDKHPIDNKCAFNIECALDYTVKKIKENKGYLWSTYNECL